MQFKFTLDETRQQQRTTEIKRSHSISFYLTQMLEK